MTKRTDKERLDFIADPAQLVANITLPTHCVKENPHSIRDAIDTAMDEFERMEKGRVNCKKCDNKLDGRYCWLCKTWEWE